MHQNGKTYHWCRNHNGGNGMWVVHLPDECKASEKPNARFQKPAKSENENQTAERGKRHLKLSENLQASLMSDNQLHKNQVNQLIWAYIPISSPYGKTPECPSSHHGHLI